ncbi:hypothetical protein ACJ72_01158 [Emergomyces africanus]|uniref:Uncharacterized protein n=1 Tax=Emergomyces africanus TaxID=1955775 RepID=A0A1B7P6F2_9EURO|nr:hypothetical protein ACJ72_01158 [Emergomyces africanus]
MPIKLPRGFARRKSSGNVLEELDETGQRSFKVFERPGMGHARMSFDGATTLNSSNSDSSRTKRLSEDPYADNIFANTDHLPPPAEYRSASSAKFSSSSTLPSSTDIPIQDIPVPPVPESSFFSLRSAAGRTFSFGSKSPKSQRPQEVTATPRSRETATTTERATTSSTTSTATPPRLPDSNLDMGDSISFGNMFDGLDKEQAGAPLSPSPLGRNSAFGPPPVPSKNPPNHPTPLRIDRSKDVEPSPHTNESQDSRDGLMSHSNSREEDAIISRPPASRVRTSVQPSTNDRRSPTSNAGSSSRYYRNTIQLSRTPDVEDEDAKIVNNAVSAHRRLTAEFSPDVSSPNSTPVSGNGWQRRGALKQIQRRPTPQDEDAHLVASLAAEANIAELYEEKANNSERRQPTKVMTPAQFERYREHKEMTRKESNASSTHQSDGDSDHYDEEEDEAEKAREAAKQRKKQEAHLSVYRQQMMKVTGEGSKVRDLDHNGLERPNSVSPVNDPNRTSFLAPEPSTNGKISDGEEEDDDVPLAILAAALCLGAQGVAMGTRFLACSDAAVSAGYQREVLRVADGGVNTARTTVYDVVRGFNAWPERYDGRGVVNETLRDKEAGMDDGENQRLYKEEMAKGDAGWGQTGRMTTYAGTGIGLVREVKSAEEIVRGVVAEAREILEAVKGQM